MVLKKVFTYLRFTVKKWGKNYNVVERADKVIETQKLCGVAPRHPGTQEKIDVVLKERPEIKEDAKRMPDEHLFRLKDVRVASDKPPLEQESDNTRELPQNRVREATPIFGYTEPKFIPEGKCSLQQALEFIINNNKDPKNFTAQVIAEKYKMKITDVQNILSNFRTFEFHYVTPQKKTTFTKEAMDVLGIMKVKQPNIYQKFRHLKEGREKIAETEQKK